MDQRVTDFIRNFHTSENGNLAAVFQKALEYFYVQAFVNPQDKERVRNMILMVATEAAPAANSTPSFERDGMFVTEPPLVRFIDLENNGKGDQTFRGAYEKLTKRYTPAGAGEHSYTWGLMQRYNYGVKNLKSVGFSRTEERFVGKFKDGARFYFFGATQNETVPYLRFDGKIFVQGTEKVSSYWSSNRDCAVVIGRK
jgi:hypothetical protein